MLTALSAALTMTACSSVPEITGTDYTVEAPVVHKVGLFKGNVKEGNIDALYDSWSPTKENIVRHADTIIEGTVISFTYTSIGCFPWTKLDVVVNESYDGELCAGDAVSIYYLGGYMPLEEHYKALYADNEAVYESEKKNGTYHFTRTFQDAPKPGSTFLFCIAKMKSDSVSEGAYSLSTSGEDAIYEKSGDGIYYCKANETEWTADELRKLIEERDTAILEAE